MLKGFEDITFELTEYEKDTLLPMFVQGFSKRIGKARAITNKEIVTALRKKGAKISDARVRKIIEYIRVSGEVQGLVASSNGYWVSTDPVEIGEHCHSLEGRENAIRRVRKSLENYRDALLNGGQSKIL